MHVKNEKGQVAIRRYRRSIEPFPVHIPPDEHYLFITRNDICIGWVEEKDVEAVLKVERGCCGSTTRQFYLADEMAVGEHGR